MDDVEGEIVEAAEAPDAEGEERGDLERWVFENQEERGKKADEEEQNSFEFDQAMIREVFHNQRMPMPAWHGNGLSVKRLGGNLTDRKMALPCKTRVLEFS
ncbi:MAG: hypothetical protein JWR19_3145 [Pedosphaera sp.]|nr:hypothetical protein [Pedosphaera sp.]